MRCISCVAVFALMAFASTGRAEETLQEVKADIESKQAKIHSLTADEILKTDMVEPNGDGIVQTDKGTVEYLSKDGKNYFRADLVTKGTYTEDGQKESTDAKSITIFDGEYVYSQELGPNVKQAMKSKTDPEDLPVHFIRGTDEFDEEFTKLLPEETLKGRKMYVVEVGYGPQDDGGGRRKAYLDKETGVATRFESYDENGKLVSLREYSNVKVNPSIPLERFRYEAPAGIEVVDLAKDE